MRRTFSIDLHKMPLLITALIQLNFIAASDFNVIKCLSHYLSARTKNVPSLWIKYLVQCIQITATPLFLLLLLLPPPLHHKYYDFIEIIGMYINLSGSPYHL